MNAWDQTSALALFTAGKRVRFAVRAELPHDSSAGSLVLARRCRRPPCYGVIEGLAGTAASAITLA